MSFGTRAHEARVFEWRDAQVAVLVARAKDHVEVLCVWKVTHCNYHVGFDRNKLTVGRSRRRHPRTPGLSPACPSSTQRLRRLPSGQRTHVRPGWFSWNRNVDNTSNRSPRALRLPAAPSHRDTRARPPDRVTD